MIADVQHSSVGGNVLFPDGNDFRAGKTDDPAEGPVTMARELRSLRPGLNLPMIHSTSINGVDRIRNNTTNNTTNIKRIIIIPMPFSNLQTFRCLGTLCRHKFACEKLIFHTKLLRIFYLAMKSTPNVPGPQWLETTPPALVSRISSKIPRLSR